MKGNCWLTAVIADQPALASRHDRTELQALCASCRLSEMDTSLYAACLPKRFAQSCNRRTYDYNMIVVVDNDSNG